MIWVRPDQDTTVRVTAHLDVIQLVNQSSFFELGTSSGTSSDMTLAAFAAIFSMPSASAALSCYG